MKQTGPVGLHDLLAAAADKTGTAVIIDIPGSYARRGCEEYALSVLSLRPQKLAMEHPRILQAPSFTESIYNNGFYDLDWLPSDANINLSKRRFMKPGHCTNDAPPAIKLRRLDDQLHNLRRLSWLHICDSSLDTIVATLTGSEKIIEAHKCLVSLDLRACANKIPDAQMSKLENIAARVHLTLTMAAPNFFILAPAKVGDEIAAAWRLMQTHSAFQDSYSVSMLGVDGFREVESDQYTQWRWSNESSACILIPIPVLGSGPVGQTLEIGLHHFVTKAEPICFINNYRTEPIMSPKKLALKVSGPTESAFALVKLALSDTEKAIGLGIGLFDITTEFSNTTL